MCMVSAVLPQAQQALQNWPYTNPAVAEIAKDLKEVLQRLDRLDKAMGLRDCKEEEATKAAFLKKLDDLAAEAKKL